MFGAKKKEAPQVAIAGVRDKLSTNVENIELRIKKMEHDYKTKKLEAVQKAKNKDKRGAMFTLKRAKQIEKEIAKLEGQ